TFRIMTLADVRFWLVRPCASIAPQWLAGSVLAPMRTCAANAGGWHGFRWVDGFHYLLTVDAAAGCRVGAKGKVHSDSCSLCRSLCIATSLTLQHRPGQQCLTP